MSAVEFYSISGAGVESQPAVARKENPFATKPVEFYSISRAESTSSTKNILVVEDDRVVAKMFATVLERQGYKVHTISDGNQALAAFEEMPATDMVLLDIVLPYVDGYRLLERICTEQKWKNVPKIMISSNSNESNIVRAFEIGVDDYITKPIQIDELVARVNRFLR